jgi:hypothetical protein
MKIEINDLLTLRAYSDKMGFSDTKTRYLIKQGKIKSIVIGGDESHKGVQFVRLKRNK